MAAPYPDRAARWTWVPIPLLFIAMIALWSADLRAEYPSPQLAMALNLLTRTLASACIMILAGQSVLESGEPGVLLLGCGAATWGLATFIASALASRDANIGVTISNVGAWSSALCHLAGAITATRTTARLPKPRVVLTAAYLVALGLIGLVTRATLDGRLPVFFIQDHGGTPARWLALGSAIAMFVIAAFLLRAGAGSRSAFARWYAGALLLIAVGLFGLMIEPARNTALDWTCRGAQYLGAIYMLVAAAVLGRQPSPRPLVTAGPPRGSRYRYAFAVATVIAATAIRLMFLGTLGTRVTYITFFPAVALAALYGGTGAGLLATVLSVAAADWFWVEPAGGLRMANRADQLGAAIFALNSALVIWGAAVMRRTRSRAAAAEAQAAMTAELARANEALRESEARLRRAQEIADVGSWEWDLESGALVWSEQVFRQLGESRPGFEPDFERFRARVHSQDLARFDHALERALAGGERFELEFRVVRQGGDVRMLHSRGELVRDPAGRLLRMVGVSMDVTERKLAEGQLARDHRGLELLHALSARLVSHDDLDALLWSVNNAAIAVTGAAKGTLQLYDPGVRSLRIVAQRGFGRPFLDYFASAGDVPAVCGEAMRRGGRVIAEDVTVTYAGTRTLEIMAAEGVRGVQATPMLARDGTLLGMVATHWTEPHRPDERTLQRLDLLVREAAHLIEHRQREAALREAGAAKDRFLAVLSHELRTPLSPLLMSAMLLESDPELPERCRNDVRMMRRNVELEARLIEDLLDVTRIVQGKMSLVKRVVDGRDVLERAVETCRSEADDKGVHFTVRVDAPEGKTLVFADSARLQQVLWNLLKNAIKFTPRGGRVEIRCMPGPGEPGSLVFEVRDNGDGISAAVMPRIFHAFEQAGDGGTVREGGLGLGLAIARGLVEAHHGALTAASEGTGKGATFRVELPLADPALLAGRGDGADAVPPASTGAPLSILIVEDHASTAEVLTRFLRRLGFRVTAADSVASAIAVYEADRFDLLISDLGLPDGDGYELLERLQAIRPVPALALSGYGMEADVARSRSAGFVEHLIKPVSARQLQEAISRVTRDRAGAKAARSLSP